jgi:hypothetical protein
MAGVLPVAGVGFIPAKSSWPVLIFSVFLGVLMAVAIVNPRLRDGNSQPGSVPP